MHKLGQPARGGHWVHGGLDEPSPMDANLADGCTGGQACAGEYCSVEEPQGSVTLCGGLCERVCLYMRARVLADVGGVGWIIPRGDLLYLPCMCVGARCGERGEDAP